MSKRPNTNLNPVEYELTQKPGNAYVPKLGEFENVANITTFDGFANHFWTRICCYGYLFLLMLVSLILVGFCFSLTDYSDDLKEINRIFSYLQNTTGNSPISNVLTVGAAQTCPQNYTPLIIDNQTSTQGACFDPTSNSFYSGNSCTGKQQTVEAVPPIPAFLWKQTKICIKRSNFGGYTNSNCPKGYKKCGAYACIANSDAYCPVNNIWNNNTDGNFAIFSANYSNSTSYLLDLQVSIGVPCLDSNFAPNRTNGTPGYPLMNIKETGCFPYGSDPASIPLDTFAENDFYNINSMKMINNLPLFSNYSKNQLVYLVARYTQNVTDAFYSFCKPQNFNGLNNDLSNSFERAYMIFKGFGAFLLIIDIAVLIIIILKANKCIKFNTEKSFYFLGGIMFIMCLVFSVISIIIIQLFISLQNVSNLYSSFGSSKCFQANTINQFLINSGTLVLDGDFTSSYQTASALLSFSVIMGAILLLIIWPCSWINICRRKKMYAQNINSNFA